MRSSLTLILAAALAATCSTPDGGSGSAKTSIAVIPKGTTHVFWRSVEAGARRAASELGVEIIWKGPLKENDRALQISVVEQFVTEGVSGIVLAPLDDNALLRPVRGAMAKGIPVIIFDSNLNGKVGEDFVSFVATDNYAGGRMAGEEMARLLEGRGKVAMLRYMVGSASTTHREQGFLDALKEHPGIELILENQYGGATSGESIQKSEELLDTLRQADGIFCPNESSTYGMLVTLRKHNLAGKVRFVGFDSSEELVRGLEEGQLQALVLQNPRHMGYMAVKTMVDHLNGRPVPERIDTGVTLVTRENLDQPEIRQLVKTEE
ncbi:MAG: substrate-binding domain-containing protein [Acidobacteriota bacterium]